MSAIFMKKILYLILILSFTLPYQGNTQSREKRKAPSFSERLWYGGSLGLGFSSSNIGGGLQGNIFFLGISPMVGYKLNDWLSVGPRADLQWYTGRYREFGSGPIFKYNAVNFGGGIFTRAKVYKQLFFHAEYGAIQYTYADLIDYQNNKIVTNKEWVEQMLVGAGLSFGGPFASEFSVLIDLLAPDESIELPIVFRYGFTYNF
jgi:hypothetical protein